MCGAVNSVILDMSFCRATQCAEECIRKFRNRKSSQRSNLFKRLSSLLTRKYKKQAVADVQTLRQRRKRKAEDEPFSSGDSGTPKLVDLELYYTEQQRNKQLTDQLIQSQKQLEDTCREWDNQVSHLEKRVAQAETEFRSLKFSHTKEKLKCALLVQRIKWYDENLQNERKSIQLLKDEVSTTVQEKELLEQQLQEVSSEKAHLDRQLADSKDIIIDLEGQLGVLKQKTKNGRVALDTSELREALRKERKKVLDLTSRLKSSHRAVQESIAKEVALRDALSLQEKKCAKLKRKVEQDQIEIQKVMSRERDLQAALDIDKSIMTELTNRLTDHQKLTEELKAALDSKRTSASP